MGDCLAAQRNIQTTVNALEDGESLQDGPPVALRRPGHRAAPPTNARAASAGHSMGRVKSQSHCAIWVASWHAMQHACPVYGLETCQNGRLVHTARHAGYT
jgi:hypothetical protein